MFRQIYIYIGWAQNVLTVHNRMMNREQTEDLKAFEQRLIECVDFARTCTRKWMVLLMIVLVWVIVSLVVWWLDDTEYTGYIEMLTAHKSLTSSILILFVLYIFGIYDRTVAPHLLISRCRTILQDYNMSCDEQGKLILKKKPSYDMWKPG